MPDLKEDVNHLSQDVKTIHDLLQHLTSHSKICHEMVRESNVREASELFEHLGQIDDRIHEVQKHIDHINEHLDQATDSTHETEELDIDDLKHDARHTCFDLHDIHTHIEHLITHANMCREIMAPKAEEELAIIKQHLEDIDENAHELLEHIKDIRGNISTRYPEFIWSIPDGLETFLAPTELVNSDHAGIKNLALKLVDGCESVREATINILIFTRDFLVADQTENEIYSKASHCIETLKAGGGMKAILACALARAIIIPARLHFARVAKEHLVQFCPMNTLDDTRSQVSISWPEFYIDDHWTSTIEIFDPELEVSRFHNKFIALGIRAPSPMPDPQLWKMLPGAEFTDDGVFVDPSKYLASDRYFPPPPELDRRSFAQYIYVGC